MSANRSKKNRFTKTQKKKLLKNANFLCEICGIGLNSATMSPHHIIPVSEGGLTVIENGSCLCASCHTKKHQ